MLDDDRVELWLARVGRIAPDIAALDGDERAAAARLRRPEDRSSYVTAHVLLRELLSARLGVRPQDVEYTREPCPACGGPHGRPALADPRAPLHFSLSRCEELVLIGIAPSPVGVDLEAVPSPHAVVSVSALLHSSEHEQVRSAAPADRPARFAQVWANKEAYLKAIGVGVATDLAADDAAPAGARGWDVHDVPAPAGYAAAVARAVA